mmetsp:Transcript_3509/g.7282  ORF Transcript_3509/g.7282 Transcript_3509/m.7282 type:complete len:634 (+) Transcript_3509:26-1927(+)
MQKGGLDLTESELKSLTSAMKKPEFRSLLNDYLEEISDPKNKAEYDAYLEQLEASGELPPGRILIKPEAHSCIKTHGKGEQGRSFKIFLNLCISDKIPRPTQERKVEGSTWSLPYAVGQPRHDQDGVGKPCLTFDCAFNPYAFQVADSSSRFKQLMCETAISGANQLLKKQGEKASSDYKVLKNKKCKGGAPGAIIAAQASIERPDQAPKPSGERTYSLSEEGPKLYRELMASQFKDKRSEATSAEPEEVEDTQEQKEDATQGVRAPKYKLVHSNPLDYADCIDTREKAYKRPALLRLEIQVPLLDKLSDASIDLQPKLLVFALKDIYYLEVKLPYEVEEAKANAKFDRKKKRLNVTLPTLPVKDARSSEITRRVEEARKEVEGKENLVEMEAEMLSEDQGKEGQKVTELEEIKATVQQPLWEAIQEETKQEEVLEEVTETPVVLTEVHYKVVEEEEQEAPTIEEISSEPSPPQQVSDILSAVPDSYVVHQDVTPEFTFKQIPQSKQAFILFSVPGLIKASVIQRIFAEEAELKFTAKVGSQLTNFVFRLKFHKPIEHKAASVDKIIDYVSLKFTKQEAEDWPEAGTIIEEITSVEEEETAEPQLAPEIQEQQPKLIAKTSVKLKCPLIFDLF